MFAETCRQLFQTGSYRPDASYYQYAGYHDKRSCGTVFNPSTGFCKEKATITRSWTFDPKKYQNPYIKFTLYTLMTDNDVTDIHITTTGKDKGRKSSKDRQL